METACPASALTMSICMQNHYNLLYREEEREMLPLRRPGRRSHPVEPAGAGRLTRPWSEQTARSETDEFGRSLYGEESRSIVEAVLGVAAERGIGPARVALAWLQGKPGVDAPIVGATKFHHLDDAVAAVELRLDDSEVDALEKGYQPRAVAGFS